MNKRKCVYTYMYSCDKEENPDFNRKVHFIINVISPIWELQTFRLYRIHTSWESDALVADKRFDNSRFLR